MNIKKFIIAFFVVAILTVIGFGLNNKMNQNLAALNLVDIEALAAYENSKDDEQDITATSECANGTTCECTICMKGSTDCSPSCPCCIL